VSVTSAGLIKTALADTFPVYKRHNTCFLNTLTPSLHNFSRRLDIACI